jgi:hypothetical protein
MCRGPRLKEQILSGAVQITESLTVENATMNAKHLRHELLSRYDIRLKAPKINELRHFLRFEYKPLPIPQG